MNIEQLKKKPELVKLCLDDKEIVDSYGESITFFMRDHIELNDYFDFYRFQSEAKSRELFEVLKKIILKEDGSTALVDDDVLPTDVTISLLIKVNEFLGKLKTRSSTLKTGEPQE